jgi:hypothetical protein
MFNLAKKRGNVITTTTTTTETHASAPFPAMIEKDETNICPCEVVNSLKLK